ncbi:MAG: response regulator [Cyclobacteriaceae bacterium]|nr:response regulator [Cyclobacteriaceae bacterium]
MNLEEKFNIDKPSILYVDDERDNLTTFKSVFRRHYDVSIALSGMEGIEILKTKKIDLVITDQRMPEMTGVDFLKETVHDYPDIIRMILTGFSDIKDIIEAINKGKVYAYITKPWHKDELKLAIDNALQSISTKKIQEERIIQLEQEVKNLKQIITELKAKNMLAS